MLDGNELESLSKEAVHGHGCGTAVTRLKATAPLSEKSTSTGSDGSRGA